MSSIDATPEPPADKIARRLAHHMRESAKERNAEESARKIETATAVVSQMRDLLAPIMADIVGPTAQGLPDGHPMKALAETFGSPESVLLAGLIDVLGFVGAVMAMVPTLGHILIQESVNAAWQEHPNNPLPPADIADMMERNILGQPGSVIDPYAEAAKSGIDSTRLDLLTLDTGEPYGVMEALSLYRRGDLTLPEFEHVLFYSRVRNEFLEQVLKLAYNYMSPADAVEIALKGIEPTETAYQMFLKAGGYAENWTDLLAAAGNPIGVVNAVNQYYHQVIDYPTVESVIRHSRINPMFEGLALNEHLKWLTATQIHQAVKAGTLDTKTATAWLITDGYSAEQSAVFAGSASSEALAGHKNLSVSIIEDLYNEGTLLHDAAVGALQQLGYSVTNADYILGLQDAKTQIAATKLAVARIRSRYVVGHITDAQATALFLELKIPPKAQQTYLATWKIEAGAEVRTLSEAQVGRLYARGNMNAAEAIRRWEAMGYSADDAALLVADYKTTKSQG